MSNSVAVEVYGEWVELNEDELRLLSKGYPVQIVINKVKYRIDTETVKKLLDKS